MSKTKNPLLEIIRYIWQKKVFLFIWVIIITSIFSFFSSRLSPYKGEMIYTFPQPEEYFVKDTEMIGKYGKSEQFNEDFSILDSEIAKQFIKDFALDIKKKHFTLSIRIQDNDSTSFKSKLQETKLFIDSLYVSYKIRTINDKIDSLKTQILEITHLKASIKNDNKKKQFEKYSIVERSIKNYFEYLVTKKYSYEKLVNDFNDDITVSISSTNGIILILGGFIFSIWSGLMIIIITYFTRSDQ